MKPGYDLLRLAVLVIAILLAMSDVVLSAGSGKMKCTSRVKSGRKFRIKDTNYENQSFDSGSAFWLRNECHDGFVVVKEKTRVWAQHEGLDRFDPEVKLIKETCIDAKPHGSHPEVMTRLFSPSEERYICLNSRGRVRAVKRKKADRMGRLCAFFERRIPDPLMTEAGGHSDVSVYINLQSAHNPDWYLGFGPNPRHKNGLKHNLGMVHTQEGYRAALPRRMPMFGANRLRKHRYRRRRRKLASKDVQLQVRKRCDYKFATGKFVSHDLESRRRQEWSGLFNHLSQIDGDDRVATAAKSKTATSKQLNSETKSKVAATQSTKIIPRKSISFSKKSDKKGKFALKRRQLITKYRSLKKPSYLYLHNTRVKTPKKTFRNVF